MASWMVHLQVADMLLDKWEGLDKTAFVMGNIAPDSGVPNEDWTKFTPDSETSHFKIRSNGVAKELDVDRFEREYLSAGKIKIYSPRQYSFFLGYWTHLVTDVLWARRIWTPCKEKYRRINGLPENMTDEEKQSMIWTIKADWYDLDFLYLKEHPEFRAFKIYREAVDFKNEFMDIFSEDAFENRRKYITEFYLAGRDNLDREYPYLTKAGAAQFAWDAAEEIYGKRTFTSFSEFKKV